MFIKKFINAKGYKINIYVKTETKQVRPEKFPFKIDNPINRLQIIRFSWQNFSDKIR